MNKLRRILFKGSAVLCFFMVGGVLAQKQSKTYKETFTIADDAVINLNTSHADIEFESWDKNQVVVEAIVELDGASEEEANAYFERDPVEIKGNSKQVDISTGAENSWFFRHSIGDFDVHDFVLDIPEFPELEPLFLDLEIPDLPPLPELMVMPPMPPMPIQQFDYEEYKKDGEAYMKKWKEEFDKNFDENYKQQMEEWSKHVKERSEEWKKRMEERQELYKERQEERAERLKERAQERAQAQKDRQKVLAERQKEREEKMRDHRSIIISRDKDEDGPSIFYRSFDGENKKYKIKKTIKIKLPKSARLKMNVRHGEVKLAENTRNLNATLSYARLHATTIDGDETNIVASYSPVSVQTWNYGKLNTNFSGEIALKDVKNLVLSANASDVTIGRLLSKAMVKNNLGVLRINSVSKNFQDMDISMQNAELFCELPSTPYTIYVDGRASTLSTPAYLVLDRSKNNQNVVHKGYHLKSNADRSISITSQHSEVVLDD